MLGQLQMDVDDSLTMYGSLWNAVHQQPSQPQGEAACDSARLEHAIRAVLSAHGKSGEDAFAVAADHGCRVFVISV
jgi:hypothetical protein